MSRAGLISGETKEIILNRTYRQPKTVTQLAREIGLSQPVIYKHVKELLASEVMREADLPEAQKSYRVEKYYEPNFPVLLEEDLAQLNFGQLVDFWRTMQEQGVLMFMAGRWFMSIAHTDADVDQTLEAADSCMARWH